MQAFSGGEEGRVPNVPTYPENRPVEISGRTADRPTLLAFMYVRFREKRHSYTFSATFYRRLDTFLFFLPLMGLQCAVAVVYVVATENGKSKKDNKWKLFCKLIYNFSAEFQRMFSGCVSAISAVLIAIQMRSKFGESAEKYAGGARQYALLASETFFKWLNSSAMTETEFQDFVKDTGQLEKEIQDTSLVPPSWISSRYEQHRMQLSVGSDSGTQMSPVCMTIEGENGFQDENDGGGDSDNKGSGKDRTRKNSRNKGKRSDKGGFSLTNLPPPDDMKPPDVGLLAARSRLRLTSHQGGPTVEVQPPRSPGDKFHTAIKMQPTSIHPENIPLIDENVPDSQRNRPDIRLQRTPNW